MILRNASVNTQTRIQYTDKSVQKVLGFKFPLHASMNLKKIRGKFKRAMETSKEEN